MALGVYSEAAGDLGPLAGTFELPEDVVLDGEAGAPRPVIAIDANRFGRYQVNIGDTSRIWRFAERSPKNRSRCGVGWSRG